MPAQPLTFDCEGVPLVGMLHVPASVPVTGVVVIVGGPQYRVGSHRQFVHLCRALEEANVASLRFDVRGMGDSGGTPRNFEQISADIRAAVDALLRAVPSLDRVVLWGLCDAATAAVFYAPHDRRIKGLTLLNPWVRDLQSQASTVLETYYGRRLFEVSAWLKLLREPGRVFAAIRSVLSLSARAARSSRDSAGGDASKPLSERMSAALTRLDLPLLLILSGDDLTAAEFRRSLDTAPWPRILGRPTLTRVDFEEADHTFSRQAWRDAVSAATRRWLETLT